MFARKQRPYEAIPPTRAALLQHTKRAAYQAGCIWGQATQCQPEAESPADWGWKKLGEQWGLFWTANAPVAQSCEQLSVAANQSAVEDANVLDWGSLAQNCAIANVNKK